MNASQLFQDIATNCLTEVTQEACAFHSEVRGVLVRQSFYIYPDDAIVSLMAADGSYEVLTLSDDDIAIFRNRNPSYFQ